MSWWQVRCNQVQVGEDEYEDDEFDCWIENEDYNVIEYNLTADEASDKVNKHNF